KRLDEDRFKWPRHVSSDTLPLSEQQLTLLLQGFDVMGHKPVHYQTTL
nr:hypothetical protein [Vibrio anguillarum]